MSKRKLKAVDAQRLDDFKKVGRLDFDGITVLYDKNREQMHLKLRSFPSKQVRDELVLCGFRWSRRDMAWYKELRVSTLAMLDHMRTEEPVLAPLFRKTEPLVWPHCGWEASDENLPL